MKNIKTNIVTYFISGFVYWVLLAVGLYISDTPIVCVVIILLTILAMLGLGCNIYAIWLMIKMPNRYPIEIKDTQKYRRKIYQFFRYENWNYETTITYIKVFEHKHKIVVEIGTHHPGILIGKAGHFIDSLLEHLNTELNGSKEIKIDLKECKIWCKLYS